MPGAITSATRCPSLGQRLCAAGFAISPSDIAAGPTERIGPVVARIVVAVIVPLLLPTVVPPRRFVQWRAQASGPVRLVLPMRLEVLAKFLQLPQLPDHEPGEVAQDFDFRGRPLGAGKEFFQFGVRDRMRELGAVNGASRNAEHARKRAARSANLLYDQATISESTLGRRHRAPLQRLRRLDPLEEIAGLFPIQFDGRVRPPAEDVDRDPKGHEMSPVS